MGHSMRLKIIKQVIQHKRFVIIIQNKSSKHFNILFASMDTLQQYKDISQLSNFKTPATARWYFEVKSEDDLVELKQVIDFAYTQGLKVLFV